MSFACVCRSAYAPSIVKAALVAAACVSAASAFAAEVVWKGGGETAAWSDGSNWEGGTAPASGDTAVIPAGKSAVWSQTDAALMNTFAGITLDGEELPAGVYGKIGGTYEDGTPIPARRQLSCITGEGYLETEGSIPGLIFKVR